MRPLFQALPAPRARRTMQSTGSLTDRSSFANKWHAEIPSTRHCTVFAVTEPGVKMRLHHRPFGAGIPHQRELGRRRARHGPARRCRRTAAAAGASSYTSARQDRLEGRCANSGFQRVSPVQPGLQHIAGTLPDAGGARLLQQAARACSVTNWSAVSEGSPCCIMIPM